MTAHTVCDWSRPLKKQLQQAVQMGAAYVVICRSPEEAFEAMRAFQESPCP